MARAWLVLAGLGVWLLVLLGLAGRATGWPASCSAVARAGRGRAPAGRRATCRPGRARRAAGGARGRRRAQPAGRPDQACWRRSGRPLADLSHRLRTPLTALRLDAEALRDPDEAARIAAGRVDALERAVTAVIQQARAAGGTGDAAGCDAAAVVGERLAFWSVLAEEQRPPGTRGAAGRPAAGRGRRGRPGRGAGRAARQRVRAHPGRHRAVRRRWRRSGGGAVLTVADAGPGFADVATLARRGESGGRLDRPRPGHRPRSAAALGGGSMHTGNGPDGGAEIRLELAGP